MRRIYFFFLLIILFPFWDSSLNAQEVLILSLDEAVFQAIDNNLGLKVERYTPFITSQDILIEKGAFDPSLSLEGSKSYQDALSPSIVENVMQRLLNEKGAEYDYHISLSEYEKVKGTLLMKFGISDPELGMTETTSYRGG